MEYNINNPCPHCGGDPKIANPTGKCSHVYYPEAVNKELNKPVISNDTIEDYEARIEMLKRRIAQLESNVKPASDLWGQHKQMIKLAEDYRLYLAANWAINMGGHVIKG